MSRSTAMRLWRRRGAVAGAALLLAALGWIVPPTAALLSDLANPASDRVYGVSEVAAGLAREPTRWLGTTLRVRGVMVGARQRMRGAMSGAQQWPARNGGWEIVAPPRLADPAAVAGDVLGLPRLADPANMTVDVPLTATMLPVSWGAPNLLWAWLRRLPLLGHALSRPQAVQWDRLATYRVRLRMAPRRACPLCYEAVLLDAA